MNNELTIIVPVFNEEESLLSFFSEMDKFISVAPVSSQVLFVNDGSTDGSETIYWQDVLDEFYRDFVAKLEAAQGEGSGKQAIGGMRANLPTDTDIECPKCGRPMQIRTGSTGVFLGCSGYSLPPKERCTATLNLLPGEDEPLMSVIIPHYR